MNETRVVPVELSTDVHDAMAAAVQHAIATSNPCAYWTIARAAFDALISAAPAPNPSADGDAAELRRMLAFAYSGRANLYGDDGCLEDNSTQPFIDYINDPVSVIREKIRQRGMRKLEALNRAHGVEGGT